MAAMPPAQLARRCTLAHHDTQLMEINMVVPIEVSFFKHFGYVVLVAHRNHLLEFFARYLSISVEVECAEAGPQHFLAEVLPSGERGSNEFGVVDRSGAVGIHSSEDVSKVFRQLGAMRGQSF
eukprot:CAMPEP_0115529698 /NCGR_PEP_ID=MMETSP0271-20121206/84093_1 /TAXON_ID=71861 /ORGANISM="Scrippsiella trochoidea, Strain CCMP3099" /LENGTH=122 /DNA_ID=CAMNT_0002961763 /DNA_START=221 /DNA_END=589 /DNA_ORIENTATION=-